MHTVQVHYRGLTLPHSSTNLDRHHTCPLSLSSNQISNSFTLSEDMPEYSVWIAAIRVCFCQSLNLPAFPVCPSSPTPMAMVYNTPPPPPRHSKSGEHESVPIAFVCGFNISKFYVF